MNFLFSENFSGIFSTGKKFFSVLDSGIWIPDYLPCLGRGIALEKIKTTLSYS